MCITNYISSPNHAKCRIAELKEGPIKEKKGLFTKAFSLICLLQFWKMYNKTKYSVKFDKILVQFAIKFGFGFVKQYKTTNTCFYRKIVLFRFDLWMCQVLKLVCLEKNSFALGPRCKLNTIKGWNRELRKTRDWWLFVIWNVVGFWGREKNRKGEGEVVSSDDA